MAATLFVGCCVAQGSDTSDSTLNAVYRETLKNPSITPDFLRWTETKWIAYRDAEANLDATIKGGMPTDEVARKASLQKRTEIRIAELRHLAKDRFSGDLPPDSAPDEDSQVEAAYSDLRNAVTLRHDPELIAAVIEDQKAWGIFSQLQADYDGFRPGPSRVDENRQNEIRRRAILRMDILRLAQLQADLSALAISGAVTVAPSPAPVQDDDRNTTLSPDNSIRIEQVNGTSKVYSNKTGESRDLPKTADELGTGRDKPTVEISEYAISPDNAWIFRTQKFYHGMCGAYLYKRTEGLEYDFATKEPLDALAWKFFQKEVHGDGLDVSQGGVVRGDFKTADDLRLSLNAAERLTFADVNDWEVDYNLTNGTFSVPAEVTEHDHEAFKSPNK